METRNIPLQAIAWTVALLPFVSSHVSYLLAASAGHVDWCVPYWDACTSISATGRQLPEKLWFKFTMIPAALAAMGLWWCARGWCICAWRSLGRQTAYRRSLWIIPYLGSMAAVFLMLYTVALGEEGDAYRLLRRSGVILTLGFTYLAQLLLTRLVGELGQQRPDPHLQYWYRRLLAVSIAMLAVGIFSVILSYLLGPAYDDIEDAIEWLLALLLNLYFIGIALCWRKEKVSLGIH